MSLVIKPPSNFRHAGELSPRFDVLKQGGVKVDDRGIGLYGVSEDVRRPHHSLLLHFGLGSLEITEELESSARRTRLFPGTLAFLSIPT